MDDEAGVESLDALRHLPYYRLCLLLEEWLVWMFFVDVLIEVARWHQLCDGVHRLLVFKALDQLEHLGAVVTSELLHNFELLEL